MSTTQTAPVVPAKPRRHWLRGTLLVFVLILCVGAGYWWYTVASTQRAWAAAEADADNDLPRWRLLQLEEDRPEIPDNENSAFFMMALRRKGGGVAVSGVTNYDKVFEKLPPNAQLNGQQETLIRDSLKPIVKEVDEAYQLKDMPRGRYPIDYSDDGISTTLPQHFEARNLIDCLQHDAYLRAQDGDYDKAVEASQAMLMASSAFETDVFLIALLIRVSFQNIAVKTLERTLGQGQASDEKLQAMQAALQRQFDRSSWLRAIRGERAMIHHMFANARDGKIKLPPLYGTITGNGSGLTEFSVQGIELWLADQFPSSFFKSYPALLQHHNRLVEISKLPFHERTPKLDEWANDTKATTNTLIRLLAPAVSRANLNDCRTQAMMRSAAVAIACERYRLKDPQKSWPESLDVLVKEKLLDAIPADPFDGQPLRYRRTKDGIVVYSVGVDRKDNGGNIDREKIMDPGVDIGFQMWNVDRRRQAAPPVVVFREGE